MKTLKSIILILISTQISFAQTVDFKLIKYNELNFYSTKSEIIEKFGQPVKSYDPNYSCGFLSTELQEGDYLTLDYGKIKFTGNDKELFVLEKVDLENDNSIEIKYGNHNLTCETKLSELIEIFGNELAEHFRKSKDGSIIIFQDNGEDGIRINIKNGKLVRFEYWSPC